MKPSEKLLGWLLFGGDSLEYPDSMDTPNGWLCTRQTGHRGGMEP